MAMQLMFMAFDNDRLGLFFFGHAACRGLVALPGMELRPLPWRRGVLTSGPPGEP